MEQLGRALGAADTACVLSMRLKPPIPSLQFFGQGWGNMDNVEDSKRWCLSFVADHHAGRLAPLDAREVALKSKTKSATVRAFRFSSPMAAFLASACHVGEFDLVMPSKGVVRACVLILPGTGDSTYAFRRHTLAEPLSESGIASILLMPAYVGSRRPASQFLHYVSTVEGFCLQSSAVIIEGLALLGWARDKFPGALLAVTGLSWGGGMAGIIGCIAKGYDLAIVPCLTSAGADVLVTGGLRFEIAFGKLVTEEAPTVEQAAQDLLELLSHNRPSELIEWASAFLPSPSGTKVLIQVQATHDVFVPPQEGLDNFSQIRVLDDKAELIWVPGGHVSSFAAARRIFLGHIVSALQRLEAKLGGSTFGMSRL